MFFIPLVLNALLSLLLFTTSIVLASPLPRIADLQDNVSDTPRSPYLTRFSQRITAANVKLWDYVGDNTGMGSQARRVDIFAERASEEPVFISVRGLSPPPREEENRSFTKRSIPMGAGEHRRSILEMASAMQADLKRDSESNASSNS